MQPPVLGSNKHTPHEGESRDITTIILQHRQSTDYKPVQTIITKTNLSKTVIQALSIKLQSLTTEDKTRRLQHVAKVYQASPSMVLLVKVIAGRRRIPFYGPARRQWARIGQASDLILKSHTWKRGFNSKAEYSNTQQDLTDNGSKQPTLTRLCKALWGSSFSFAEKQ